METIRSFEPVAAPDSRVLVLGSMPGIDSLRAGQYYAHARNAFWPILFELAGEPLCDSYDARTALLVRHGIALWDVLASCVRTGSLDAAIRRPCVHDFEGFYRTHQRIGHVLFNGRLAEDTYRRKVGFSEGRIYRYLPSTSPAHAISFADKKDAWAEAFRAAGVLFPYSNQE